jgi:hypothetical protein
MNWYTAHCPVCNGTLHDHLDDEGWVTCFSCARSFSAQDVRLSILTPATIIQLDDTRTAALAKRAA